MSGKTEISRIKSVVGSIARTPMLIDKNKALDLLFHYNSILESVATVGASSYEDEVQRQSQHSKVRFYSAGPESVVVGQMVSDFSQAPKGSVAVIPVMGAMMRDNYCTLSDGFIAGTRSLERTLLDLDANENVDGIVFQVNTPGGEARGNESLSKIIKSLGTPTVVHFEGMASAGVYAFQGAKEIYAAESNSYWGSIGTYVTLVDDAELLESMGLKLIDIYAPQSTEKNKEYREALAGNMEPMENKLKVMTESFIKDVKNSRPSLKDDGKVFKGKLYNAVEAQKMGAIDGIKTLDFAIKRARFLSRKQKREQKKTNHNQTASAMSDDKKLSLWNRVFGDSTAEEAETDIEKTEKAVAELKEKISNLEKEISSKNETIANSTEKIESLENQVKEISEEFAAAKEEHEKALSPLEQFENCNSVQELADGYSKAIEHNKKIAAADPNATPIAEQQMTDHNAPEVVAKKQRTMDDILAAMDEKKKAKQ